MVLSLSLSECERMEKSTYLFLNVQSPKKLWDTTSIFLSENTFSYNRSWKRKKFNFSCKLFVNISFIFFLQKKKKCFVLFLLHFTILFLRHAPNSCSCKSYFIFFENTFTLSPVCVHIKLAGLSYLPILLSFSLIRFSIIWS